MTVCQIYSTHVESPPVKWPQVRHKHDANGAAWLRDHAPAQISPSPCFDKLFAVK